MGSVAIAVVQNTKTNATTNNTKRFILKSSFLNLFYFTTLYNYGTPTNYFLSESGFTSAGLISFFLKITLATLDAINFPSFSVYAI